MTLFGKFGEDVFVATQQTFPGTKSPAANKRTKRRTANSQTAGSIWWPFRKTASPKPASLNRWEGTKYKIGKTYDYSKRGLNYAARFARDNPRTAVIGSVISSLFLTGAVMYGRRRVHGPVAVAPPNAVTIENCSENEKSSSEDGDTEPRITEKAKATIDSSSVGSSEPSSEYQARLVDIESRRRQLRRIGLQLEGIMDVARADGREADQATVRRFHAVRADWLVLDLEVMDLEDEFDELRQRNIDRIRDQAPSGGSGQF